MKAVSTMTPEEEAAWIADWSTRLPPDFSWNHGTNSTYTRGCRCAPCTAAARDRTRRYRAKKAHR